MSDARTVVESFYNAVQQRDMVEARHMLADDMEFAGLFETYPNADSYISTFSDLMKIVTRLDIEAVIAEGNDAGHLLHHAHNRARSRCDAGGRVARNPETARSSGLALHLTKLAPFAPAMFSGVGPT